MRLSFKAIPLLFAVLLFAACQKQQLFNKNQEKWLGHNIQDYTVDMEVSCFCAHRSVGTVRLVVTGGVATSILDPATDQIMIDPADSVAIEDKWLEFYPTINGIFEDISTGFEDNYEKIQATYDPTYGFPVSVYLDVHAYITDEETGYELSNFTVIQ